MNDAEFEGWRAMVKRLLQMSLGFSLGFGILGAMAEFFGTHEGSLLESTVFIGGCAGVGLIVGVILTAMSEAVAGAMFPARTIRLR